MASSNDSKPDAEGGVDEFAELERLVRGQPESQDPNKQTLGEWLDEQAEAEAEESED